MEEMKSAQNSVERAARSLEAPGGLFHEPRAGFNDGVFLPGTAGYIKKIYISRQTVTADERLRISRQSVVAAEGSLPFREAAAISAGSAALPPVFHRRTNTGTVTAISAKDETLASRAADYYAT